MFVEGVFNVEMMYRLVYSIQQAGYSILFQRLFLYSWDHKNRIGLPIGQYIENIT